MADRPLILPGWAVRAVLREIEAPGSGKSQHQVVLKNLTRDRDGVWWRLGTKYSGVLFAHDNDVRANAAKWSRYLPSATGDRLWVRETWADLTLDPLCDIARSGMSDAAYRATDDDEMTIPPKWRSSATMPRWASRLTLLVTAVRVQRVQDITEDDARAEGCKGFVSRDGEDGLSPQEEYRDRWADQHGPDAWARNDWVLALTFRPIPRNIDMEASNA